MEAREGGDHGPPPLDAGPRQPQAGSKRAPSQQDLQVRLAP